MTDKEEAQIEREKQAVAAMTNAKSNMAVSLERIQRLEAALKTASTDITRLKRCIGQDCKLSYHDGRGEQTVYVHGYADEAIHKIMKVMP